MGGYVPDSWQALHETPTRIAPLFRYLATEFRNIDLVVAGISLIYVAFSLHVPFLRQYPEIVIDLWYLEAVHEADQRPVAAYELHQEGPSLPAPAGVISPSKKQRYPDVPEALAELPGVVPPDPDTPDWEYTAEA